MLLDALRDARALLFPVDCAGCGSHDRPLCDACRALLGPAVTPRPTRGGLVVHTALRYEAEVRRIVLAFKEEGRTDLARPLGHALSAAVERALGDDDAVVVPVPTSRESYKERGFDPLRLLVRRAGIPHERLLGAARVTRAQKALGFEERAYNLRGALAARRPLAGQAVLLVDDVLTTGATLDEAARAVREAGGRVVGAATVAFTPRLLADRDIAQGKDYGGA